MRIQAIFLLLIICKACFSQDSLQIFDSSENQSLMNCDYFDFELVSLSSLLYNSIDTIVEPIKEGSSVYWYLDFSMEKDSVVVTLSKQHIEQFMLYNKMHKLTNKILIVNNIVVLVRDNKGINRGVIEGSKVSILNPKSLDSIYFIDYPYWKFSLKEDEVNLIRSSTLD